ncbi:MAG: NAD-dependent succinate-semialdehyde dehydrogenase [Bifidobacterium psychraerophilum]
MPYQTVNPFTNETVRTYDYATAEQIDRALDVSHRLYLQWKTQNIADRAKLLRDIASALRTNQDELARVATLEMGKLFRESRGEVELCAVIADYFADHGAELLAPAALDTRATGSARILKQSTGVVLAVEPWNFPYYQIMRVFAPNFMVGNPLMLKHASNTPGAALAFEDLVKRAGAPSGSLTNLFLAYDQVGSVIADPRVQGIALTGSTRGGTAVAQEAGKNLKKNSMELGGSDAFIVLADADVTKAVELAWRTRLYNAGQVCTSSKRFIVADSLYDEFIEGLKKKFSTLVPGDPMDKGTTLAPLSSQKAKRKIQSQIDAAIAAGAHVEYGNTPIDMPGQFLEPTILTEIDRDNPAYSQEMFGPVAQVYRAADDDVALALANDGELGLGGIVYSGDLSHGERVAERIESGMVFVNTFLSSLPELPFGGIKASGYGRELSSLGLMAFVNEKLVLTAQEPDFANGVGALAIM